MKHIKQAIKGVGWMAFLRATTRGLAFVRLAILARVLSPLQFGVYGIASLILALLEIFTETGVNVVLVQSEGKITEYLNTAWVVSIFRGVLISLLMIALSYPASLFFKSRESLGIILFLSIVPLLRGFINPMIISFQKELEFNKEFYLRSSVFLVDALISVGLGVATKSAYCLVFGLLGGVVLEIFLSFYLVKPTPRFEFDKEKLSYVVKGGRWMTFAGIFDYFFRNGDDMVVGRVLGASSLGLYQVAYKISTLPVSETGQVFNKVAFPLFSKISQNKNFLRSTFFKTLLVISLFVFPFGIVLFSFANFLVPLALGEKWISAVPVVRVLSVFGISSSLQGPFYSLFLGVKKQDYVTYISFFSFLAMAVSIIPLVFKFGVMGAAYSALFSSLLSLPFFVYGAFRVLK